MGTESRTTNAVTMTSDDEEGSSDDDGWAVSKRKTHKKV